jgi:hypothetical protein
VTPWGTEEEALTWSEIGSVSGMFLDWELLDGKYYAQARVDMVLDPLVEEHFWTHHESALSDVLADSLTR